METEDPRQSLGAKRVAERCAACRDLALIGTWADLPELVRVGWTDPSMPVRLYAAAAAADLVGRRRGAHGQDPLSAEEQAEVLKWAFGGDPGTNPSMLMLVGAVETPESLKRLGRIVRDPRADVRFGVVTAMRRMLLSAASDREHVGEVIDGWFDDDRVPDDTRAELARVAGEAGLQRLRPRVLAVGRRSEALAEVADLALDRLAGLGRAERWAGVWRSDGLDVFELAEGPREDRLAVSDGTTFWSGEESLGLVVEDGRATLDGRTASLVWATPLGSHTPVVALQVDGRTWWGVPAEEAADVLESRWEELGAFPKPAREALRAWAAALEGAAGQRAAIIAAWLAEDHEAALELLDPPMRRQRPRTDLFWWRGRVRADAGDKAGAAEDLAAFLDKSKKDGPFVEEAKALLASL